MNRRETYGKLLPMTKDELYEANLRHNGWEKQAEKAVEEMAELTQQLMKAVGSGTADYNAICMELADVRITCEQLWRIYGADGLADDWYDKHLHRQADRLAEQMGVKN